MLKVAARSNPKAVARAFAGAPEEDGVIEIHTIGAGAVKRTVKAIAIVRSLVEDKGPEIKVSPGFIELSIVGKRGTSIRFIVERSCTFGYA